MVSVYKYFFDEPEIGIDEIGEVPFFWERVLRSRAYVAILCEHFTVEFGILPFNSTGFSVMPYPYTFMYRTNTVLRPHIAGFWKMSLSLRYNRDSRFPPGG